MALRQASKLLPALQAAASQQAAAGALMQSAAAACSTQQLRFLGGDKVPQYWGRPSPYTEGTDFLGTPANHMELINKRPLSPDVFELDMKGPHYKFPLGALSSVANRVTGVALSVGFAGAGYVALTGDLPGALVALKTNYPLLCVPLKMVVAWPLIYHFLGGMRHFVWDLHKIGNQADKSSLLETPAVEESSKYLFAASVVLTAVSAVL